MVYDLTRTKTNVTKGTVGGRDGEAARSEPTPADTIEVKVCIHSVNSQ